MIWLNAIGLYLTITGFVCMALSYLFVRKDYHLSKMPYPFKWREIKTQFRSAAGWRLLLAGGIMVALGPALLITNALAK